MGACWFLDAATQRAWLNSRASGGNSVRTETWAWVSPVQPHLLPLQGYPHPPGPPLPLNQ